MELATASAVVSFAVELETDAAEFYKGLARQYPQYGELFLSLAQENERNASAVRRAYYEAISDVLEAGFSFSGLDAEDYLIQGRSTENAAVSEVVGEALKREQRTQGFYATTARQAKSLMADLPRAFERMAKNREKRKLRLRSLLAELEP